MGRRSGWLVVVLIMAVGLATPSRAAEGQGAGLARPLSLARFEHRWIDLAQSWGEARACLVAADRHVECFRSEQQLDTAEGRLLTPDVNCSSPLRLYDGINRTGTMVAIYARGSWINLSTYGFDNKTSSYSVGACAAEMASGSGGGGSLYPGCLDAWCVGNSMASGWNNVVSSVYLY
jgi:hypothetical protein